MGNIVLGEQAYAGQPGETRHDMHIALAARGHFFTPGTVVEKTLLNQETILLTPECKDALEYTASIQQ